MWRYNHTPTVEIYHHGILGQKWGKQNGPPYPLGSSDHSTSEKKAGWRKSLTGTKNSDKDLTENGNKGYNKNEKPDKHKRLSDKQKKAIKIGAAVAAAALVAVGTYSLAKSGKLDGLVNIGKTNVSSMLAGNADEIAGGIKKLATPESFSDTLKNANPRRFDGTGKNNCVASSIAGFMRQRGYDVSAKSMNGQAQNPAGVVEECFKDAKILEGSAIKFGRSPKDAAEMLVNKYGDNAEGVCGIQWQGQGGNNGVGHCFSWKIKDGNVTFFDAQRATTNIDYYWEIMDSKGNLTLARLDNAEINMDTVTNYVESRK